jgi:hypothetical protein
MTQEAYSAATGAVKEGWSSMLTLGHPPVTEAPSMPFLSGKQAFLSTFTA